MEPVEYSPLEDALVRKLVNHFGVELSDKRCQAGNVDGVLEAVFSEGAMYGCFLEFNGGREDNKKTYSTPTWIWSILCVMIIRYDPDVVEANLRSVLNKLAKLFRGDHTLGNMTPLAKIVDIGRPDVGDVNEVGFYFLPFIVEVIGR